MTVTDFHNHEWWLHYINEYKSSEKNVSEYCREKGLSYDAFWWHLKQERKKNAEQKPTNNIEITSVRVMDHPLCIEVNGVDISGSISDLRRLLGIQQ